LVRGEKRAFGRNLQGAAGPGFDYKPKPITHKKAEEKMRLKPPHPILGFH